MATVHNRTDEETMKAILVVVAVISVFGVLFGVSMVSTNNTLVGQEEGIKAQYEQNKNSFDAMVKKVRETAQVPDIYRDDLEKIIKAAITGRYGENGAQQAILAVHEQNIPLDPMLYGRLQQVIESGRNQFAEEQRMLIDKKRVYQFTLRSFPDNMFASFLGFPKLDLSRFDVIISDETERVFQSGRSEPIKLRQ
jgi:hypothetical protein